MFYDENLTDGSGLDAGITVAKLDGSGNLTLNLTPLLTELAADGVAIGAGGDFMATVSLNPADEISASISDANGRSVAQGRFAADGTLVTLEQYPA